MTMLPDSDVNTNNVITSTWGRSILDRIVQQFTTRSQLFGGSWIGTWQPVKGSLAYCQDVQTLYKCVVYPNVGGTADWEPLGPRGELGQKGFITNQPKQADVDLPNAANTWREILTIKASDVPELATVGVRLGYTYLFSWQAIAYIKSGSLSLWDSQCYFRAQGTTAAIGGAVRRAGSGWTGNLFGARTQSGITALPALSLTGGANEIDNVEFVWRGATYAGYPVVTLTQPCLSVIEVGGPH